MQRRDFLTASSLAVAAVWMARSNDVSGEELPREFYELRVYEMPGGNRKKVLNDYLSKAAIPAWNRAGIKPVGAFSVVSGANSQDLFLLLPYPNLQTMLAVPGRLASDAEYQNAAAEYLGAGGPYPSRIPRI